MLIYGQIKQIREAVKAWKREGKSVGFVPRSEEHTSELQSHA